MINAYFVCSLIGTFLLSVIFIGILVRLAPYLGLLDIPSSRSCHKNPIPRGAGIGIFLAIITISLFHYQFIASYWWVLASILIIWALGVWDDIVSATPKLKLALIGLATLILIVNHLQIGNLGMFFGKTLHLPLLIAAIFTLFAVAGFTNAFNLIDGLDGLSSLIGIIILSAFAYIGFQNQDILMFTLSTITIVALLAFLFFNWNPAKIFLGDSGSLMIGFIISIVAIESLHYIRPIKVLFIAALPLLDTLIVMLRRKVRGKSAFFADKTHLHHITLKIFKSNTKKSVLFLAAIQFAFTLTGLYYFNQQEQYLALMIFAIIYILLYLISTLLLKQQEKKTTRTIKLDNVVIKFKH